jgi:hypothetical protein
MHAVAALFAVLADKPGVGEPYFEDQAVAEVGFGFESAVSLLTSFFFFWMTYTVRFTPVYLSLISSTFGFPIRHWAIFSGDHGPHTKTSTFATQ